MSQHLLAIVVPAFKPDFLEKALRSIERQTNQSFQVYIFDDGSPHDLAHLIEPFLIKNEWVFHRFEENLGGRYLVAHWNRCVSLTTEPWVWLFSDDDVMSPDCVESFLQSKDQYPTTTVFRFEQNVVDAEEQILDANFPCPSELSAFEFGKRKFYRELNSSAVEFIFARTAFEKEDGFVRFPLGWCSDDASWIAFSGQGRLVTLPKGKVFWRMSSVNISGTGGTLNRIKISSSVQFVQWFNQRFREKIHPHFQAEQVIWLRLQMVHMDYMPSFGEVLRMLTRLQIPLSMNWFRAFGDLYCLTYVYWKKVVKNEKPLGLRYWLSLVLPAF